MRLNPDFWRGRRVLVTGHTGFKGSWLAALLTRLGATVSGQSLPPSGETPLYGVLHVPYASESFADIRDANAVADFARSAAPETIFHLAAQPIVRQSYADPVETFATNVLGTAHVLEAARKIPSARSVLVITTDKVYENLEQGHPFVETDRLGGHDPYSTSKACAELVTASYRQGFFAPEGRCVVATARSGNVIGGGDWSKDRIVPDIVRGVRDGKAVRVRNPDAVRPWLHVIETIGGYVAMAERMAGSEGLGIDALNFAPDPSGSKTVAELADRFFATIGAGRWEREGGPQPHEAQMLTLSAKVAGERLGWHPQLLFAETVDWTADWYREFLAGSDMAEVTEAQIGAYLERLAAGQPNAGFRPALAAS